MLPSFLFLVGHYRQILQYNLTVTVASLSDGSFATSLVTVAVVSQPQPLIAFDSVQLKYNIGNRTVVIPK